ncbi:MAG: metalloprotease TldD, partial [Gammaproteobacteria bacterium]|nr:metalloprotease TldD [Gammaproteobacteria bacterium]
MSEIMQQARQRLLEPTALGDQDLDRLMSQLMSNQVDYADIYFEYSRHESWSLEEGKVKSGSHSIDQGVGIRAISGEKTGFA